MKVMLTSTYNGSKKKKSGVKNFPKAPLDSFQNIPFTNTKLRKERTILKYQMMRKHTTS